jgi:sugar lactone lactonase YvrE
MDGAGNLFVPDAGGHLIRKVTPEGVVTTVAGVPGVQGSNDGPANSATFDRPAAVAVDAVGNVFVWDCGNNTIRRISASGQVSTLAGTPGTWGSADGVGSAARFGRCHSSELQLITAVGIAVSSSGLLYVTDPANHTIRKLSADGTVTTLAGLAGTYGSADGHGATARFRGPSGITLAPSGNLYVVDHRIIRMVTPAGDVTTIAGSSSNSGYQDGTGSAASFESPKSIAAADGERLVVTDGNKIRQVTTAGVVTTLAGSNWEGSADGDATTARFLNPHGVAVDALGRILIADTLNHTIRRLSPEGMVSTLAGSAVQENALDGVGIDARFGYPAAVATDAAGNVYVADTEGHAIRKISTSNIVTTLAGSLGQWGYANGNGPAARFLFPQGIATDSSGYVYVGDTFNGAVRKIAPNGDTSLLAARDGVTAPVGVAVDRLGSVYFADAGGHTVNKVAGNGEIITLAGLLGQEGYNDGVGADARFYMPWGIAVDASGAVFVSEYGNHTIRKITPDGAVTTVAGTAGRCGSADGPGHTALLCNPRHLTIDDAGNLYVADTTVQAIRKIAPNGEVSTVVGVPGLMGFKSGDLPGGLAFPAGVAIHGRSLYISNARGVAVVAPRP